MSSDTFKQAILYVIAFILSVTVHEFGHAWVANRLGDPTPRSDGRLTLSPLHHIDWIGTVLFPMVGFMMVGTSLFAWGRPVMTRPNLYTRRFTMATGRMFVAVAGPAMNLVMAIIVSLLVVVGMRFELLSPMLAEGLLKYIVVINLSLMFFNLLPVPPLDGGDVLAWVLPRSMQSVVDFLRRWGFMILLALMLTNALSYLMIPARIFSGWFLATVVGAARL